MSIFDSLTGEMALTKTIVNELRPIGRTKDYIALMLENVGSSQSMDKQNDYETELKKNENTELQRDVRNLKALNDLKPILDDMFRFIINAGLESSTEAIDTDKLRVLYELHQKGQTLSQEERKLKIDLKSEFMAIIDHELQKSRGVFGLDKVNNLTKTLDSSAKGEPQAIFSLLKSLSDNEQSLKDKLAIIKACKGNMTQLSGFQDNRNNAFNASAKSASVSYRSVEVNLARFFENIEKYNSLKVEYPELAQSLLEFEDVFTIENYINFLTQDGIVKYNEQIGRKSEETFANGVNQRVNLYKQKHGQKGDRFPRFAKLYNQLLFGGLLNEYEAPISSDEALFAELKTLLAEYDLQKSVETLSSLINDSFLPEFAETLYIKTNALSAISHRITGDYAYINNALEYYYSGITRVQDQKKARADNQIVISIFDLQNHIDAYKQTFQVDGQKDCDLLKYFKTINLDIVEKEKALKQLLMQDTIDKDRELPTKRNPKGGKGFQETSIIKDYFDSIIEYRNLLMPLYLYLNGEAIETPNEIYSDFYVSFDELIESFTPLLRTYNRSRNYLTKKPFSTKKYKLSFGNPTLLDGWARSKEKDNWGIILLREGLYYLGIARNNRIIKKLNTDTLATASSYQKLQYHQIPGAAKSLNKKFFSKSLLEYYAPSRQILKIRENEEFRPNADNLSAVHEYIAFMQQSIAKTAEYDVYNFSFKDPKAYNTMTEFYDDVDKQGFSMSYSNVDSNVIDKFVETGELLLFQIFNKDFSPFSKGKKNLNTLYFQEVFSMHNLDIIKNGEAPFFKLCGECEIFMRPASIKRKITHPANEPIAKKRAGFENEFVKFPYDIIKDKRYTETKLTLHTPIQINARQISASKISQKHFNEYVHEMLRHESYNLIGIDRGERNLLYYSVINQQGEILEQGSLNTIREIGHDNYETNYHNLLNKREAERLASRKSWATIETIKELKEGYVSQAVHKIASLMIEHNALLVLEDLNSGFKNSRKKIEKEVYQKLEKALVSKLNYLVTDKTITDPDKPGSFAKGLQLTFPVTSDEQLRGQIGVVHYINAARTSKIDPVTGFSNLFGSLQFVNLQTSKKFFSGFDAIRFNEAKDWFEFSFNYKNVAPQYKFDQNWVVCSHGDIRWYYSNKEKKIQTYGVTSNLKRILEDAGIQYEDGSNILPAIIKLEDAAFFKTLQWSLDLLVRLRYDYLDESGERIDAIISPVHEKGVFFDTRLAKVDEPQDADANGAYCIALKGLLKLGYYPGITDDKSKKPMQQWLEFLSEKPYIR